MTSYSVAFEPPTRINYWSHDKRSFEESGGLKDLAAKLTIYKFYVNDKNEVCDADGNVLRGPNGIYTFGENGNATAAQAFQVKEIDITNETHPLITEDSPYKVWTNEIKAQFGENYTPQEELRAKHANKYPMKAYYHPNEQSDPDGLIGDGEPVYLGDFKIYIGVKGDYDLDNVVNVRDAQNTLIYYTEHYVSGKEWKLNDDPELDGEDGLIFYLINVNYRNGDKPTDPLDDPQKVSAKDAQSILIYYTEHFAGNEMEWEDIVGYDLLDSFYGDNYQ